MGRWRGLILAAGIVAAVIPASRAAEPALHAKPGLWQVTMTARISGMPSPPAEAVAGLTAEQKEQYEANLKEQFGKPRTQTAVVKQCHTWQKFAFQDADQGSCKKPVISRTATTVDMHLECGGAQRSSISSHLQVIAPGLFTASQEILWGALRQETSYQGKWLGRNCNGLQPLD
jgi:uncharacterized protein DUF3617